MNFQEKRFIGFSLAEALITLLIISIIALASAPVITKKHRSKSEMEASKSHGKWMCAINSSGQHVYWQTGDANINNIDSWKVAEYGSCTFNVPKNGKNFSITATGGGGGGASAQKTKQQWSDSGNYLVKYYGKYRMVAIGAGGSGGDSNFDNPAGDEAAGGGGAGGVGFLEMNLTESTVRLILEKGKAVAPADYTGIKGKDSSITRELDNQTTQLLLKATGGGGGQGVWLGKKGNGSGGKQGEVSGLPTVKSYNSTRKQSTNSNKYIGEGKSEAECGGGGYVEYNDRKSLNNALGFTFIAVGYNDKHYGQGGDVGYCRSSSGIEWDDSFKYAEDGNVVVYTEIYHAGGGGKAAGVVSKQLYPSLEKSKYKVIVGYGGDGANNGNGFDGGYTVIEDLIQVPGGIGGTVMTEKGVALSKIAGGDGEESRLYYKDKATVPYGGLSGSNTSTNGVKSTGFGAGGGGGGMKEGTTLGQGADGQNGIVIIEW